MALTAWVGVGRALSPVERMRRQVDGVTAATLAGRIDEPDTGDEIARLARTLNDMLDRLDTAQEQQRRFVSDASHELKSPLAAIRQYAEVARDHPDRISGRELSQAVIEEGERLDRLVQGMLVLAQVDEGVLRVDAVDVDLDDLLFEEARRVRETGAVVVDISGVSAVRVHGDLGLLRQLVRNLVDNAVRHARHRVTVTLHTAAEASGGPGTSAELCVGDDGDGIPPGNGLASSSASYVSMPRAPATRAAAAWASRSSRGSREAHGGTVRVDESASGGASLRRHASHGAARRLTCSGWLQLSERTLVSARSEEEHHHEQAHHLDRIRRGGDRYRAVRRRGGLRVDRRVRRGRLKIPRTRQTTSPVPCSTRRAPPRSPRRAVER